MADPPPDGARAKPAARSEAVPCWVYRSIRHDGAYVYLRVKDGFELLPDDLRRSLGRLQLVMELTLGSGRRLASEDVPRVMDNLREQGFHLQIPPRITPHLYTGE